MHVVPHEHKINNSFFKPVDEYEEVCSLRKLSRAANRNCLLQLGFIFPVHISVFLSVCLSVCTLCLSVLSVWTCLSVCPPLFFDFCSSVCLSPCHLSLLACLSICIILFISRSAYLSVSVSLFVSLSVCLSVCLSVSDSVQGHRGEIQWQKVEIFVSVVLLF